MADDDMINRVDKIVNFALQGIVVLYNIVLLFVVSFVWKKKDIIIQSTIWLMLIGSAVDISDDVYAFKKDEDFN